MSEHGGADRLPHPVKRFVTTAKRTRRVRRNLLLTPTRAPLRKLLSTQTTTLGKDDRNKIGKPSANQKADSPGLERQRQARGNPIARSPALSQSFCFTRPTVRHRSEKLLKEMGFDHRVPTLRKLWRPPRTPYPGSNTRHCLSISICEIGNTPGDANPTERALGTLRP